MKRIVIESPYANGRGFTVEQNVAYARRCMHDSLSRGEAPLASHLLYTQPGILDDNIKEERDLGINAGFVWTYVAELSAFYTDHGWSGGMLAALHRCLNENLKFEIRGILKPAQLPATLDEEVEDLLKRSIRQ
jgi:hypothetical protein